MPRIADMLPRVAGMEIGAFEKVCSFSFLTPDWLRDGDERNQRTPLRRDAVANLRNLMNDDQHQFDDGQNRPPNHRPDQSAPGQLRGPQSQLPITESEIRYAPCELVAGLIGDLSDTMMKTDSTHPTQPSPAPTPKTVCFRLDAASRRQLATRAAALKMSPHDLARQYVMERLQQVASQPAGAPAEFLRGLTAIYEQIREARVDVALGVEVLLSRAGNVTEAEARDWATENYRGVCSPSPPP